MLRTVLSGCVFAGLAMSTAVGLAMNEAQERYTFVVPNAPESTVDEDRFRLTLNRWSTDDEREQMQEVVGEKGVANLLDAFRQTSTVGYLRWPGGLEYSIRYAQRAERPDGGSDVVLIVDRPVWVWWDTRGKSASSSTATTGSASPQTAANATGTTGTESTKPAGSEIPYTVVQLRLDKEGKGEGRISGGNIVNDKSLGVAVSDYASQPVLLTDVRREKLS